MNPRSAEHDELYMTASKESQVDEREKWDKILARRYAILVGLRLGVITGMILAGGIMGGYYGAGMGPALVLALGGLVVAGSLTKAMAPWVWPEGTL